MSSKPAVAAPNTPTAAGDWALIAVPGVIWGASFLFIAEGLHAVGPMGVTLVRIAVGLAALSFFRGSWKPVERSDWSKIAWLGLLWMAFPLSMFPFAEQRISSALAGMLTGAVPLTTAIIATMIARRLPSRGVMTGLAVGLVGVVLMAIPDMGDPSNAAGVLMVVVACVSYGFAPNIARPLQIKYGSLPVIWRAQMVAFVLVLPFGVRDVTQAQWSLVPVLSLLALGALGTGVAHVVMATASGKLGATRAAATVFLSPPVAFLLGVLLRNESVALLAVIGGATCVAGAWIMRQANTVTPSVKGKPAVPLAKAAAVVVLLLAAATPALAQDVLPLPRLSGTVRIDGRSDDAAWQSVPPLPLTVHLPTYRAVPAERTIARIAYDDDALYLIVDAFESHAGGVRASSMIRDDDAPGDFINLALDTFGDRQNAVSLSTTPGGQRNDWSISNDAQSDANLSPGWNGVWEVATQRTDTSWHAEFRVPFSTLRFSSRENRVEFGLHVNRLVSHLNERVTFPDIEPSAPLALWKPSRWQRVSVEGITPIRSVRVTPYVVAGVKGTRAPDPASSRWGRTQVDELGGDLKMAVTPFLTLDLTANTDFAETEVDDQQVNLTRFPLLFPERRPFFVERAGTFEVRTGETDFLFNSRRIGLTADGQPVRLLGGARLVGQVRGWDIGFMDAQTDETAAGSRENLGVLRARRNVINPRSWVGMMVTSRIASDSSQAAVGLDGDLYLGGDDYFTFGAAVLTGDAGTGLDRGFLPRGAARVRLERRRNRDLWYRVGVSTTGARYAPALGYVERTDAIRPTAEVGYGRVISRSGRVLRTSLSSASAVRNAAEEFEGSVVTAMVALDEPGGGVWTLSAVRQDDDLLLPFSPTPGTNVPAGTHSAQFVQLSLAAPTGPRAVIGGRVRVGEYFDGTLRSLTLSPEWRASAHFRIVSEVQLDQIDFPLRGESAWSRLARVRVFTSVSPQLTMSANIQSNSLAKMATANFRVRYNVREGDDLWIVYGHQENLDRDRLTPRAPGTAASGFLVKLTKAFGR